MRAKTNETKLIVSRVFGRLSFLDFLYDDSSPTYMFKSNLFTLPDLKQKLWKINITVVIQLTNLCIYIQCCCTGTGQNSMASLQHGATLQHGVSLQHGVLLQHGALLQHNVILAQSVTLARTDNLTRRHFSTERYFSTASFQHGLSLQHNQQ